jgi:hypothetical protein
VNVARRDEKAVLAMHDNLGDAANVAGNDRRAPGQSLDTDQAKGLVPDRWNDDDVDVAHGPEDALGAQRIIEAYGRKGSRRAPQFTEVGAVGRANRSPVELEAGPVGVWKLKESV